MILDKAIDRMFGSARKRNIQSPSVPLTAANIYNYLGGGRDDDTGLTVNRKTALGIPALFNGSRIYSESVAKLPLNVYRRENGGKVKDKNHPAYPLLVHQANDFTTAFQFKRLLTLDAMIEGNGYAYIYRNAADEPMSLRRLDPAVTYPVLEETLSASGIPLTSKLRYVTQFDTGSRYDDMAAEGKRKQVVIEANDILHIKGIGPDEWCGYSIIDVLCTSLGMGLAHMKYSAVFFKNNAVPNMVLTLPFQLKDETQVERFRASWSNAHQGTTNQHKVAILEGGADVKPLSIDPEKAQLLESMELDVKHIANIINVPPHFLGANISTSYNSLEQQNRNFLSYSLGGMLTNWQQEARAKLLSVGQKMADTHCVEFDRNELERADRKTEVEADTMEISNGLRTIDEKRSRDNLPPLADNVGALARQPLNIGFSVKMLEQAEMDMQQPQEPTMQQPDNQPADEPAQQNSEDHSEALFRQFEHACERMIVRLKRQAESKSIKPKAFFKWLDCLQEDAERDLFCTELCGHSDPRPTVVGFLGRMHAELLEMTGNVHEAELPRAVAQIMSRHEQESPNRLANQLMKRNL